MATTSARVSVVALVALLGFPTPASAATTCVPDASPGGCDAVQPTIQAAVDAAADGDTIRIAAGRYEEAVHAGAKTLHFVGAGAGQTGISPGLLHDGPTLPGLSMPRG